MFSYVLNKISKSRPDLPWWPMKVIPLIDKLLTDTSDVIEFGSGSSTIWLAQRSGSVISFEDHEHWWTMVNNRLKQKNLLNATVILAKQSEYYNLTNFKTKQFDLAVIDGSYRWKCVETVLTQMKPGGVIYLDNSDSDKDRNLYDKTTDRKLAQCILEEFALRHPQATLLRYSSIINGELHAGEGVILKMPEVQSNSYAASR